MRAKLLVAGVAVLIGLSSWVAAVEHPGEVPGSPVPPRHLGAMTLTGPDAARQRIELLRRAQVSLDNTRLTDDAWAPIDTERASRELSSCYFLETPHSGTTPKFECILAGGEVVKVKYGRQPEIHAEVAATNLLRMLGYPADTVLIVPHLRCYGCPRFPFAASHVRANPLTRHLPVRAEGYTDFEWVAVERRLPARPIETADVEGWHWWELEETVEHSDAARRADIDALKLLAVFLAHWDNKSENQRLVCLDDRDGGVCERPLAMIQDLGATFGPMKVNLGRWRALPIWHDRAACAVSMRALPYEGASFRDTVISEAGRAQLAARLASVADADVRRLFAYARFPHYQSSTSDEKDLDAWTAAFRHRVDQVAHARCPA